METGVGQKEKLEEIQNLFSELEAEKPAEAGAYLQFVQTVLKDGSVSLKNKELIAIALSIDAQCSWCIPYHVKMAIQAGATKGEILEAATVAVLMKGSPALMHMIPLVKALKEFT
ncbi:MAG: carboxymuconolactone decarboxylase family protein [Candidatus Thermoplasmatota archaeon]|jgi:AhpD family alkylhydroperoxidase|nr:carboxymuconolactone decarboxylase family protein [Candidatus Thermoplasmatota archaeon]MCL5786037.1 carboxymuconolactone decarboxylase family protein [Candidatus Thermoplasmatota archaeon]